MSQSVPIPIPTQTRRHELTLYSSPSDSQLSPFTQMLTLRKVHPCKLLFEKEKQTLEHSKEKQKHYRNSDMEDLTGDEILLMHQPKGVVYME